MEESVIDVVTSMRAVQNVYLITTVHSASQMHSTCKAISANHAAQAYNTARPVQTSLTVYPVILTFTIPHKQANVSFAIALFKAV